MVGKAARLPRLNNESTTLSLEQKGNFKKCLWKLIVTEELKVVTYESIQKVSDGYIISQYFFQNLSPIISDW